MKLDEKQILINSLRETVKSFYITKSDAKKFIKTTKIGSFNIKTTTPRADIIHLLKQGNDDLIDKLNDYEYNFYYKYGILYKFTDNIEKILEIFKTDIINKSSKEYLSFKLEYPILKEFKESYDLKFSLITNYNTGQEKLQVKYPVIISFFKEKKNILFKFSAYHTNSNVDTVNFYGKLSRDLKNWLKNNITENISPSHSLLACKNIFIDIYEKDIQDVGLIVKNDDNTTEDRDVRAFAISSNDLLGGKTSLYKDKDFSLPLIGKILSLTNDFENDNDKDIIRDFLKDYVKDSKYNKIALAWNHEFPESKAAKSQIFASVEKKSYIIDEAPFEFEQIHFHHNRYINRERINYVINKISEHL